MLVKIFKSNQQLWNIVAVLLLSSIWVFNFSHREVVEPDFSLGVLWFDVLVGIVLVSFQSVFLNVIVNKYNLLNETTHLPGLLLVFFSCLSIFSLTNNQIIIANSLLVLVLYQVLNLYNSDKKFGLLFNSGLLIGLATIFYMPSIVYFIMLWIALIYLSTPVWRDFAISLIGFVVPIVYYVAYFYVFKDLSELVFISKHLSIYSFSWSESSFWTRLLLVAVGIYCAISCFYLMMSAGRSIVRIRKMLLIVLLVFLVSLTTLFLNQKDIIATITMTIPALSIIMANFLQKQRKSWVAELVFLSMVFLLLMSYFS